MKHFARWATVVATVAAAAVPAILVDPSFGHYIAQHPWAATYLPLAAGALKVLGQALKESRAP